MNYTGLEVGSRNRVEGLHTIVNGAHFINNKEVSAHTVKEVVSHTPLAHSPNECIPEKKRQDPYKDAKKKTAKRK